jgi:hypothetical protein
MEAKILVTDELATRYFDVFVNRLAFTIQSPNPDPETGRHYYYRPKARNGGPKSLSLSVTKNHLVGQQTIGLYAINPKTQRSKWVAIDADYENALEDLLKLQWELRQDGVAAALEKSRRGGHLWIFNEKPLLARDCRVYIYHLAVRLKVPVKGSRLPEGIEVFPKQSELRSDEFGSAIRAPLGVHRGTGKRYWFYGADYTLDDQITYLSKLKRITEDEMRGFVAGLEMPEGFEPKLPSVPPPYNPNRREFRILDYVIAKRRSGRNYWTRCPSCAQQQRDQSGDNLAICIVDPRKYKCWAGCTKEMIRAALGCPIRSRRTA